ncbi:hypothetical protein WICPIJ_007289 [Wickerhamomyces pijperi]|uniref:Uncharacterized protein n=1 Tax=Wickerhamomyces pijperi TaxID=599730 RepID=A0A9P8Q2W6_WICPI|nr:hypothetical protein WICPIJ_007289 [Wickerhamomyces pijperi]
MIFFTSCNFPGSLEIGVPESATELELYVSDGGAIVVGLVDVSDALTRVVAMDDSIELGIGVDFKENKWVL